MNRICIVTTHPIQYYAPVYQELNLKKNIDQKVFYTWSQWKQNNYDKDFGQEVKWDIPLLKGYDYEFVTNRSKSPDLFKFNGIKNPDLIPKIKEFGPDAILVFGWAHHSHLQIMRYFKGNVPIWFRGDSTLLDYDYKKINDLVKYYVKNPFTFHLSPFTSYFKFKLRTLFLRWIYSYVDKAFYVGTANKAYYFHHGLKESQLVYAPHAVDNERFFDNDERQYEKKARQWRRELGIPDEAIVILFAGKFEPKKNPGILIDALIHLNEQQSATSDQQLERSEIPNLRDKSKTKSQEFGTANQQPETSDQKPETRNQKPVPPFTFHLSPFTFHLILVGSGKLENELHTKASKKGYIHFLPFQNQSVMPVVYRLGDIFCLPSQGPGETWGLAVNEAFASSRPAIVSDKVGCNKNLIVKGKTGYTFAYNDSNELQKKLAQLNKESLAALAKNANKHVHDYSTSKIASTFETAIKA